MRNEKAGREGAVAPNASPVAAPAPLRKAAGKILFTAIALYGLLFVWELRDARFIVGDEGVATMGAWRILQGQVPHRDFFEIVPPFSFLPTALVFALFDVSFATERGLVVAYAVVLAIATERLMAAFSVGLLARGAVLAFLIPFGVFAWSVPSHHWVADITQLLALVGLARGCRSAGRRTLAWGASSGVLTGLAVFTLQDQGAYLVVALPVLFFPWIPDRTLRRRLLLTWAVGGLAVAIGFAAYLLPHVSVGALWEQWVVFPATRYKRVPGNVGSVATVVERIGSPQWLAGVRAAPAYQLGLTGLSLLVLGLPLATPALLGLARLRRWQAPHLTGLLAAGSVAFIGGCLHRYALINLIWAAPLPLAVLGWTLDRGTRAGRQMLRWGATGALSAIIAASIGYAQGILSLASSAAMIEIRGPAGTLRAVRGSGEATVQAILDAIESHVPRGAPVFVTGFNPLLNFWTLRPNPTRYNFLLQPYHTESQAEEVWRAVRASEGGFVLLFQPSHPDDVLANRVLQRGSLLWRGGDALLMALPADTRRGDGLASRGAFDSR